MIDESGQLLGVVDIDTSGAGGSTHYTQHQQHPVFTDTPLHEVLEIAANLPYPVPVLDRSGALTGTLSKSELLQTLSRH
ncbi:hypothetical protein D3C84_895440 [compost metagenome]